MDLQILWFVLVAVLWSGYFLLEGFDFGVGMLLPFLPRNEGQRSAMFQSIGPVWDGNEVWLIAAGGLLVFAFPRAYAVAFSGFYLPLMLVLWLLVLRGVSIELRSHHGNPLWRQFFDAVFALSSAILALVLGVALGNVLRGVPLDQTGYFSAPLFSDFGTGGELGALDWYTVTVGLFAVATLAAHGAMFLRWKTAGALAARASGLAGRLWIASAALAIAVTAATAVVRPALLAALAGRPGLWILPAGAIAGFAAVFVALRRGWELGGFIASGATIAALLGMTAGALYPHLLPSSIDARFDLDIAGAANSAHGLAIGLMWWIPAIALAIGYFVYLFRSFRGKTQPGDDHA